MAKARQMNTETVKVCLGCEGLVARRVETCPGCCGYHFDESIDAIAGWVAARSKAGKELMMEAGVRFLE